MLKIQDLLFVVAKPLHDKNYIRQQQQQMQQRKSTLKEKFQQEIERTRVENEELMRLRITKKKIDLNARFEKKDVHNILNSLLQGQVIEEDLFNQFWHYYFHQAATMREVLTSYNATLLMLIQKIAKNNNRMGELTREKERLKQSHDFKNVNMVNLELQGLQSQTRQFREDLKELSKPFQFNFAPLIQGLNIELIKAKTLLDQSRQEKSQDPNQEVAGNAKNMFDFITSEPEEWEEKSEEVELQLEEKYHRFAVYVSCIALVIDLSMIYNKFNFLDIIAGLLLVGNSLMEDYLLKNDLMNRIIDKVEVSFIDDKLMVRDTFTSDDVKRAALLTDDKHSFQNYANSSFALLLVVILWDLLWLLVMKGAYYDCQGKGFTVEADSFSFWKYNRYILYASIFTLGCKVALLGFMFQIATLTVERVFTRHNIALLIFRFSDINEAINSLIHSK